MQRAMARGLAHQGCTRSQLQRNIHLWCLWSSKEALWQAVESAIAQIPPAFVQHLYASIPSRLQAVIDAVGGHTKY
ncbi:hypothetical protein M569_16822 [Genlisea aurea]|uniref:4'-phosphopantetheinyl transferase domain-containing protein n=1 Tax=Genlisea aurea TaxID=192259 RepID=S8BTS8_9LAMI|nr:hypothetical protein M569_16822 [Genlisea aurea]